MIPQIICTLRQCVVLQTQYSDHELTKHLDICFSDADRAARDLRTVIHDFGFVKIVRGAKVTFHKVKSQST